MPFYHRPSSVKYVSFVIPIGQYEHLKLPYGLRKRSLCILEKVFNLLVENKLTPKLERCYFVPSKSIGPSNDNIEEKKNLVLRNSRITKNF